MVGVFGSPGDSPMSDDDGDGVWTRTVELEKNSSFSYKFVSCLSWDCMEDLSGQSCATGEWSDRYLETGEQDTTINASFGICEPNYSLEFDGVDVSNPPTCPPLDIYPNNWNIGFSLQKFDFI